MTPLSFELAIRLGRNQAKRFRYVNYAFLFGLRSKFKKKTRLLTSLRKNRASRRVRRAGACGRLPVPSGAVGSVGGAAGAIGRKAEWPGVRPGGRYLSARAQPRGHRHPQKRPQTRMGDIKMRFCPQKQPPMRMRGRKNAFHPQKRAKMRTGGVYKLRAASSRLRLRYICQVL